MFAGSLLLSKCEMARCSGFCCGVCCGVYVDDGLFGWVFVLGMGGRF